MKRFTFILAIVFIALGASGHKYTELQNKILRTKAKFKHFTEITSPITSQPGYSVLSDTFEKVSLKNAAASQKLDSTVSRSLHPETEIWHNSWKDEFLYNSEMRGTVLLEKEWDISTQTWITISRTELTYNSQGLISTVLLFSLNEQSQELELENKIEAYYNGAGRLDSALHYISEPNESLVLESKQIYHYNALGKLAEMEFLSLEDGETESLSYIYTYNSAGNLETSSMVFYDEGEEIIFFKTFYNYNASGKRTHSEFWSISFFTFALEKSSRTDYEYNASGDISTETTSSWNSTNETWDEEEREVYTYGNLNFSDITFPYLAQLFGNNDEFGGTFNKAPAESNTYEKIDGNWKNTDRTTFYYSGGPSTNVSSYELTRIYMYPNPASDRVSFSWTDNTVQLNLRIYNVTGTNVIDRTINSNNPVSVAHLKQGIYLIKLNKGIKEVYSAKLSIR